MRICKPNPKSFFLREGLSPGRDNSGGWTNGGLCPFHEDTRAGSFRVNLQNGAFKCFACGAKGGDVIDFLRQRYHLTFKEALRRLVTNGETYYAN